LTKHHANSSISKPDLLILWHFGLAENQHAQHLDRNQLMAGFIDLFQVTKNERHWVANLPHIAYAGVNPSPAFRGNISLPFSTVTPWNGSFEISRLPSRSA
jgi:hypothetical protein